MGVPTIADAEFTGVNNTLHKYNHRIDKKKPTQISKYVTYNNRFTHDDVEYEILANKEKKHGIFTPMMNKAIEQLTICQSKFGKVFVLAFNLHHRDVYRADNKWITRFRKNLFRKLERKYGMNEVGFIWSREQETAKGQHYHFWLYLDGRVINYHGEVLKLVTSTWRRINAANTVGYIRDTPFYDVRDHDTKLKAVSRISYCCKARGKGYRPQQTKDYSTSRLNN